MRGESDPETARLIRRLSSLPERAMRRQILKEQLAGMSPARILSLFAHIVEGAARRSPEHLVALEAIHESILTGWSLGPLYERFSEVYRLAREAGDQGVVHLFVSQTPSKGPVEARELVSDRELSRLTLGERKSIARCHDRRKLERVMLDPDPSVIHNWLQNPHVTEEDVMRLASRRPARDVIQRQIQQSRWGTRYRVRLALARNPYTPTELSVKLVGLLLHADLHEIAKDAALHETVRSEARRLLGTPL